MVTNHKVMLLYMKKIIEVTLRKEKSRVIDINTVIGKALMVTAMKVPYYSSYQVESTTSSTIEVNRKFLGLEK